MGGGQFWHIGDMSNAMLRLCTSPKICRSWAWPKPSLDFTLKLYRSSPFDGFEVLEPIGIALYEINGLLGLTW